MASATDNVDDWSHGEIRPPLPRDNWPENFRAKLRGDPMTEAAQVGSEPQTVSPTNSIEADLQREVSSLQTKLMVANRRIEELTQTESTTRGEFRKAKQDLDNTIIQLKKMSDRELESRTKAEVNEELMNKFFDKMLARMN